MHQRSEVLLMTALSAEFKLLNKDPVDKDKLSKASIAEGKARPAMSAAPHCIASAALQEHWVLPLIRGSAQCI